MRRKDAVSRFCVIGLEDDEQQETVLYLSGLAEKLCDAVYANLPDNLERDLAVQGVLSAWSHMKASAERLNEDPDCK